MTSPSVPTSWPQRTALLETHGYGPRLPSVCVNMLLCPLRRHGTFGEKFQKKEFLNKNKWIQDT